MVAGIRALKVEWPGFVAAALDTNDVIIGQAFVLITRREQA